MNGAIHGCERIKDVPVIKTERGVVERGDAKDLIVATRVTVHQAVQVDRVLVRHPTHLVHQVTIVAMMLSALKSVAGHEKWSVQNQEVPH